MSGSVSPRAASNVASGSEVLPQRPLNPVAEEAPKPKRRRAPAKAKVAATEEAPDERVAEAIGVVEGNRDPDGRWPLQNVHAGETHFQMEHGESKPSRWNTLRALRVLDWFGAADEAVGRIDPFVTASSRPTLESGEW